MVSPIITLSQTEFYTLLFGWVLAAVFGFFFFLFIKFTPAGVFLKAFMKKKPECKVNYRPG